MTLQRLFGIDLPIVQAPMAGVQGSALTIAVSNAGGLGFLPCAMLTPDAIGKELLAIQTGTDRPFGVGFFCHTPPVPDPGAKQRGVQRLHRTTRNSASTPTASPPGRDARPSRAKLPR
jgi:nitronate monooxygenase